MFAYEEKQKIDKKTGIKDRKNTIKRKYRIKEI